ncbi:zinc finger protein 595 isoform X1 [Helicoverpa armigera]|uniref:zinc finger protein 595 isoform X1 n=1 Tax=Helicoverpa armigera TaxID=29058 RepID=UPI003082A57F
MEKCRICLRNMKNLLSVNTKADGVTFADMIFSIANIKVCQNEDGSSDQLCRSCRDKLINAYKFKMDIERSEMVLQETSNVKRINFCNLSDIKIKIEIDTDCKPIMPSMETLSNKLFKEGVDCLSYNNTTIKKVEDKKTKSLSVGEFLNSIKTECDNDCDYQEYEVGADEYPSDSGSNFSYDMNLAARKYKKKKTAKKKGKATKKCQSDQSSQKENVNGKQIKPLKPILIQDLRLVPSKPLNPKPRASRKKKIPENSVTVCPYCGKLCKSLNSHILLHTGSKNFKCDQCLKAFYTQSALSAHVKTHALTRSFKCEHCIAAFYSKTQLKSHMLSHVDERKFVCDICNKAFKRRPQLERHKLTHNFGVKPIQCELCPMTFITKYGLQHHMRVHTGERPFKCEICSQPYSYKHDFNRHCLKKHGVFLKRRSIHVMNEEVLQQERALMRDLSLRAHGIIKGEIEGPFESPKGALAYTMAMKAIEANKIPIIY